MTEPGALLAWSPLAFLRPLREVLEAHMADSLAAVAADPSARIVAGHDGARVLVRPLAWDSTWFRCTMARVEHVTAGADGVAGVVRALVRARTELAEAAAGGPYQLLLEAPAEDGVTVQAATAAGMRLVETRVTYVLEDGAPFDAPDPGRTRLATERDIPDLREVAARARNPWDRYHADSFFPPEVADDYLAEYAEQSVRGLADAVIVPDEPPGDGPGAFMTLQVSAPPGCPLGMTHACGLAISVGRIRLVAVSAARQGWHRRLLIASTRWFRDLGVQVVTMTTQLGNRAVTRNSESLGFHLGRATHTLVASGGQAGGGEESR